ncbi:COR domain-containing protein [Pontibacter sp. G13]|uniref:COR domain-containing protein n=1 Tax=Pontibacter sp. G13 TaxID=3074898 RepID=UPI0028893003|nr:COR domain-containing protein [Pontibacter sp. G13]WNJ17082.1 COR domain-containing protein [Pontibacter sp. G13]
MSELALQKIRENQQTKHPHLSLARTGLREIPAELFECVWLKSLVLGDWEYDEEEDRWKEVWKEPVNIIEYIPDGIANLVDLELLDISGKTLLKYPYNNAFPLGALSNLKTLRLRNSHLEDLSFLVHLSKLHTLILSRTRIRDIEHLKNLTKISTLNFSRTQVQDIEPIKNLSNISTLNFSGTQVQDIQPIKNLTNITELYFWDTSVKDIEPIKNLSNISNLNFLNTQVKDIEPIKNLTNISTLIFRDTPVKDIEPIKNLSKISNLNFSNTQVKDIKPIQNLSNISKLQFSGTQVQDIEPIKNLSKISNLNFSNTGVKDIEPIKNLTNISTLIFWDTPVKDIEPIKNLSKISILDFSRTLVKDIEPIQNLSKISILDFSGTQVQDIQPIKNLTNISNLNFSNTQVKDIEPIKNLTKMSTLHFWGTQVQDIGPILELPLLRSLHVPTFYVSKHTSSEILPSLQELATPTTAINSDTQNIFPNETLLEALQLDQLNSLEFLVPILTNPVRPLDLRYANEFRGYADYRSITIYNQPILHPPLEIVQEGREAFLSYFEALEAGRNTVYEARMLIIGEAGAGKTTFARKICDARAPMPQEDSDTTRGIDVTTEIFQTEQDADIQMHIWDFGGQEVYHGIHQLFLSKRALYVMLLDGRIEENPHYWLQAQELLGGTSPLLMVLNEKGDIRQNPAFGEWQSEYPNFKEHKQVNLGTDIRQIEALQTSIESYIRELPHIKHGQVWPQAWVKVREALYGYKARKKFISHDRYVEICENHGVTKVSHQEVLLAFLHDLGNVLHFDQDNLRDKVFLDIQWVLDCIYRVLDHTKKQQRAGYFTKADLAGIWGQSVRKQHFDMMLNLMEIRGLELCFRVSGKDQFIVPELLPADQPNSYQWEPGEQELSLRYTYQFMPKGIVPRLIVKLHTFLLEEDLIWKRGAVFARESAIAEVRENQRDRHIYIRVKGQNCKELLTILVQHLDQIHKDFHFSEKMSVDKEIPCNCQKCKQKINPQYYFRKKDLDRRIELKKSTIECNHSCDSVTVKSLIHETFYFDNTYRSFERPDSLNQINYIQQLVSDGNLDEALIQLEKASKGTSASTVASQLRGQYETLKKQVIVDTLPFEESTRRENQIRQSLLDTLTGLSQSHPDRMDQEVYPNPPIPDPLQSRRRPPALPEDYVHSSPQPPQKTSAPNVNITYNIRGDVHNLSANNQGDTHQSQTQVSIEIQIQQQVAQLQELVDVATTQHLLSEDAQEELGEILEEIKDSPQPDSAKDTKRWKRWLNRALKAGHKFMADRLAKGLDTGISESLKKWLQDGGLQLLEKFIQQLG